MASMPTSSNNAAFCNQCGNPLQPSGAFCPSCGSAIGARPTQSVGTTGPTLVAAKSLNEITGLERAIADESYQKLLAVHLHDDAMRDWWKDPKDGQYLCTSVRQIQYARQQLNRASALKFDDLKLRADLEKMLQLVNTMEKRQYTGTWFQVVILGLFYLFPGVIWWYVNRRPVFLINRDYIKYAMTGKSPSSGAKMGGAMEKVSNFFDSITGGWGGWFALAFMVICSPIFMILAFKQNYIDVKKETAQE
jgi:hypothetical protein